MSAGFDAWFGGDEDEESFDPPAGRFLPDETQYVDPQAEGTVHIRFDPSELRHARGRQRLNALLIHPDAGTCVGCLAQLSRLLESAPPDAHLN